MKHLGWIPALVHMGVLFGLSSIPGKNIPMLFPHADKVEHLVAYGALGVLLACRPGFASLFRLRKPTSWTGGGFLYPIFGLLYGISDEVHQLYVPGRFFSVTDIVFDGLGVFLGFILIRGWDAQRRGLTVQKKDS